MQLHFTKNAEDKLRLLSDHEARITKEKVIKILEKPDKLVKKSPHLKIAQGNLDKKWQIRVVYREDDGVKMVITFFTFKE